MTSTRFRTTKRAGAVALALAAGSTGLIASTTGSASASSLDWNKVAQCESGGNWNTNTGNGFEGGLQFSPSTWQAYGGSGSAASASPSEQMAVADRVLASQGPGAWPVCSQGAAGSTATSNSTQSVAPTTRATRSTTRHAVTRHSTATTNAPQHTTQVGTLILDTRLERFKRADVKYFQHRLNEHGAQITEDGQFGPQTKGAVEAFQASHHLLKDGRIGTATRSALRH